MKNYTISCGNTSLCVDSLGAQVSSFKVDAHEYIWQRDEKYWSGSAPVLFPIVGELKGEGKTTLIDGKRHKITLHGFAASSEFYVNKLEKDSITLSIDDSEETLKAYPYNFKFSVKYSVKDGEFSQQYIIENKNEIDMPYVCGAHPGFSVPIFEGDKFEDYTLVFEKPEHVPAMHIIDGGLIDEKYNEDVFHGTNKIPLSHSLFSISANVFERLLSRSVKLVNKSGKGVEVLFPDFDYLGLWHMSGTDAPYLCIEPWTGMNDTVDCDEVYKNKRGMRFISPKETVNLILTVKTIK